MFFFAHKGLIFANNDFWNAIQQYGATAHGTRRKGGVQGAFSVHTCRLPPGILKGIHFAMQHDTAVLYPTVVPASEYFSFVNNDGTNGDAAFGHQDIAGLDVAVDDTALMRMLDGGANGLKHFQAFL